MDTYILKGKTCVRVDHGEWAMFFETSTERQVALTEVTPKIRISTVFLGQDHNFSPGGVPHIFETMTFGLPDDHPEDVCVRYSTWEQAEEGHAEIVSRVIQSCFTEVVKEVRGG